MPSMKYLSTRGGDERLTFEQVRSRSPFAQLFQSLAQFEVN